MSRKVYTHLHSRPIAGSRNQLKEYQKQREIYLTYHREPLRVRAILRMILFGNLRTRTPEYLATVDLRFPVTSRLTNVCRVCGTPLYSNRRNWKQRKQRQVFKSARLLESCKKNRLADTRWCLKSMHSMTKNNSDAFQKRSKSLAVIELSAFDESYTRNSNNCSDYEDRHRMR